MSQGRGRVSPRITLLLGLALTGLASAAQAAVSLAPAVNYPVGRSGNNVRNVAVGDFNGDGKLDMAVPDSTDRTVSILLGNGDGSFVPAGAYSVDTGTATAASPRFVAVGDFNEDGKQDLAVTDGSANNFVVILLGNGDGSFGLPVVYGLGTGTGAQGMATADLNRDGHLDLVVANSTSANVSILLGNGNGTFQAATNVAAGTNPYSVAVGDVDGDGDPDLAVANRVGGGVTSTVSILLNNGSGTFAAAVAYNTGVGYNSRSVAMGDFNRDGKPDLAVANEAAFSVSILLGNGNGTFQAAVNYPAGSAPRFVSAADFDGDGLLDLAVTDGNDNVVYVLRGTAGGSFGVAVPFLVGYRPDGVSAADFNGDGKPDVVTANTNVNTEAFGIWNVSVLLDTTTFAPTGTLAAKIDYPVGSGPNALSSGDFNLDGALDLVAANLYSDSVSFLQGVGDGTFAAAANFSAGTSPYWVATGDFNRDGKLDLAVANVTLAGNVSILLGNGNGTFQAPLNNAVGAYPVFVVSGDFNGDGRLDLAVANAGSDDVSILLGNGNGTFQASVAYGVGATPYSIAVGDFDRDGKLDLAVANYYSASVSVLLGNGDGTFQLPADFAAGYNPISIATADLDGDGLLDLAVANYWSGNVSVLSGIGGGSFLGAVNYAVGTNPDGIVISDFYRDGKPDLAVAVEGVNKAFVVRGKGDGRFLGAVGFTTGTRPAAVVTGDFDGDGKIDIATPNFGTNDVSVLLNWNETVSAPTIPAGINLNGTLKDKGVPGMSYGFSTGGSTNSLGHAVEYQFDWTGNGSNLSAWGSSTQAGAWSLKGTYLVRARARCSTHHDVVSAWSGVRTIDIGGPTITNLLIEGGAANTTKTLVTITYTVSPSAVQVRTSTGDVWSAWLTLPVAPHNVSIGSANGIAYVFAQVKDADGRVSSATFDTINQDTKGPTGVVKINGGSTSVLSGGANTTVRLHLAMFDATMSGAQVRVKPDVTFTDPGDLGLWGPFDNANTGRNVVLTGTGVKKIFVQFMDGVGLKSVVYTASITISATGPAWPGLSAVTVSNLLLNDGAAYATSTSVKVTYNVSQSTTIKVRYLYGTAWSNWEVPIPVAGKVTKQITLSTANGPRQVYVQLMEDVGSALPGAMTDPTFASLILDTTSPKVFVQIDQGVTSLSRYNTTPTYLVVTILGSDSASGLDKAAIFQTGSLPSTTVPPPADAPDWFNFAPTVESFGLDTSVTGSRSVYVWLKDKAGKVSLLKTTNISVAP